MESNPASVVGGEHSRKGPFEQLVNSYSVHQHMSPRHSFKYVAWPWAPPWVGPRTAWEQWRGPRRGRPLWGRPPCPRAPSRRSSWSALRWTSRPGLHNKKITQFRKKTWFRKQNMHQSVRKITRFRKVPYKSVYMTGEKKQTIQEKKQMIMKINKWFMKRNIVPNSQKEKYHKIPFR